MLRAHDGRILLTDGSALDIPPPTLTQTPSQ
jgi:hypothetical protein